MLTHSLTRSYTHTHASSGFPAGSPNEVWWPWTRIALLLRSMVCFCSKICLVRGKREGGGVQLARDRGQRPGEESRSVHIALPKCLSAFPLHSIVYVLNNVACSQQVRVTNRPAGAGWFSCSDGIPRFHLFPLLWGRLAT